MKNSGLLNNIKHLGLSVVVIVFVGFLAQLYIQDQAQSQQIELRAAKIFAIDSQRLKALPHSDVVALSVAMGFKNYKGAETILNRLERL